MRNALPRSADVGSPLRPMAPDLTIPVLRRLLWAAPAPTLSHWPLCVTSLLVKRHGEVLHCARLLLENRGPLTALADASRGFARWKKYYARDAMH